MVNLRDVMNVLIREQRDKLARRLEEIPNTVSCASAKRKITKDLQVAQLAREDGMQQLCLMYEYKISKTE